MTHVWLCTLGSYSEYRVHMVAGTREDANDWLTTQHGCSTPRISERKIGKVEHPGLKLWWFNCPKEMSGLVYGPEDGSERPDRWDGDVVCGELWAEKEEDVPKLAWERRRAMIVRGELQRLDAKRNAVLNTMEGMGWTHYEL